MSEAGPKQCRGKPAVLHKPIPNHPSQSASQIEWQMWPCSNNLQNMACQTWTPSVFIYIFQVCICVSVCPVLHTKVTHSSGQIMCMPAWSFSCLCESRRNNRFDPSPETGAMTGGEVGCGSFLGSVGACCELPPPSILTCRLPWRRGGVLLIALIIG